MNENIQEGTHDPTISKEGSSQQQYEQWLTLNEARLQKIRMASYIKRNPHLADLSEETLLLRCVVQKALPAKTLAPFFVCGSWLFCAHIFANRRCVEKAIATDSHFVQV
jgi:hypothetical protein